MILFGDTRVLDINRRFEDGPSMCLCGCHNEGWRERGKTVKVAILLENYRLLAVPPGWLVTVADPTGWEAERTRLLACYKGSGIANDINFPIKIAFAMAANEAAAAPRRVLWTEAGTMDDFSL